MNATPGELGDYSAQLARGAADLVREHVAAHVARDEALAVDSKSTSTDLVTDVDRASERWLVEQITHDRPDDAVLGEEGGGRPGTSGVRWVLDPIDGTVNFVLGLPQYAVSVAAEIDDTYVAGAVCNPVSGELFTATLGGGAWLGEQRLNGPRPIDLSRAVIGTGFAYDRALRRRQGAVAADLLPRVADIRRLGSAALDLCAVAAGRLDGYYETGLNPWDYGAGALIAAEAGCVVSGLRGRPISGRMAAVAGADLATELFELLEELRADEV
ncbi:MAG TPA: inositol monophosphatase family protein [Jatrophihabitantaceae bacterium]